ncbi:hypothetical protein vBAspATola_17 [Aeromonas phage vB_AspA_Tola]|nr:hypothetical protein vBAspATola_17 [Aeromonas phage vB_AspA_Tola]
MHGAVNPRAHYQLPKRFRIICPDCGAAGASNGPCYCHECNYAVMMLPAYNDRVVGNWVEVTKEMSK